MKKAYLNQTKEIFFQFYPMSKRIRGPALIINNKNFKDKNHNRIGSEVDVKNLKALLDGLGFKVK
jgi:hypothetical protein